MAGQRKLVMQEVVIEGQKFFGELEEHTPPVVEKKTEDAKGGRFASSKIIIGVTVGNATIKLKGATVDALQVYGAEEGERVQMDVKSSYQDEDGNKFAEHCSYTGDIIKIDDGSRSTQSVPETTIELAPRIYKHTEAGKTRYNINLDTQVIDLGQGDIMAEHRSNLGRA
ncbi:hypothetical protein SAMN04488136_1672 [Vibrio xiamenensis]|uniref:Phage tail tube protein FII n=1 Tax=Vibrio xiamenensis TaxID=861298 RepID=A0A1G8HWS4_9VIBR|nr:phage major tail tube protein [Vibrio xiamenensis]SDI11054.1 hypothetical protein SAMN04488136_1672 [Vibrio xiamenensis]